MADNNNNNNNSWEARDAAAKRRARAGVRSEASAAPQQPPQMTQQQLTAVEKSRARRQDMAKEKSRRAGPAPSRPGAVEETTSSDIDMAMATAVSDMEVKKLNKPQPAAVPGAVADGPSKEDRVQQKLDDMFGTDEPAASNQAKHKYDVTDPQNGLSDQQVLQATAQKAHSYQNPQDVDFGYTGVPEGLDDLRPKFPKDPDTFDEARDIESDLVGKQPGENPADLFLGPDQTQPTMYAGAGPGAYGHDQVGIEAVVVEQPIDPVGVTVVNPEKEEEDERRKFRRYLCFGGTALLLIAIAIIVPVVLVVGSPAPVEPLEPTQTPSVSPSELPSLSPSTSRFLATLSVAIPISGDEPFDDETSPQYKAAKWVSDEDELVLEVGSDQFMQRYILAVLYFSLGGDDWEECSRIDEACNRGWSWLLDTNTECRWHGVRCTDDKVDRILLGNVSPSGNNMVGTFPVELVELSDLTVLVVVGAAPGNDAIGGTIPTEYGRLTNLAAFFLAFLELEGTIPTEIMQGASNLEILMLARNQLGGPLPTEIGTLSNLRELELFENFYTGSIPDEWSALTGLTHVKLHENQITGTIPDWIWNNSNLTELSLDDNQMTGTLSPLVANVASRLELLELQENQFVGTLPTEIYSLLELENFRVSRNSFTGELSTDWSLLNATLRDLELYDNNFYGTVPASFDSMTSLDNLLLHNTNVTGTISATLCSFKQDNSLLNLTVPSAVNCSIVEDCCDLIL